MNYVFILFSIVLVGTNILSLWLYNKYYVKPKSQKNIEDAKEKAAKEQKKANEEARKREEEAKNKEEDNAQGSHNEPQAAHQGTAQGSGQWFWDL